MFKLLVELFGENSQAQSEAKARRLKCLTPEQKDVLGKFSIVQPQRTVYMQICTLPNPNTIIPFDLGGSPFVNMWMIDSDNQNELKATFEAVREECHELGLTDEDLKLLSGTEYLEYA